MKLMKKDSIFNDIERVIRIRLLEDQKALFIWKNWLFEDVHGYRIFS